MELPSPHILFFTASAVSLGGAWVAYLLGSRRRRAAMARFLRLAGPDDVALEAEGAKIPTWLYKPDHTNRHERVDNTNPMFDEDPMVRGVSRHLAKKELAHNAAMNAEAELLKRLDGDQPFVPQRKPRYHCEGVNIGLGYDQYGNNEYLLHPDDRAYIERVGVNRVGGETVCPTCGYTFYQHPPVQGALYLTRICGRENIGELVKL